MAATRLPEGTGFRVAYNPFRNRFDAVGDAGKVLASVPCDGRITACRPARVWLAEALVREVAPTRVATR